MTNVKLLHLSSPYSEVYIVLYTRAEGSGWVRRRMVKEYVGYSPSAIVIFRNKIRALCVNFV